MSTWSKQYTAPESVNGNNEYDVNSQLSLQMFVVPMNNSFYAVNLVNSIANSYIKSIVYSANEFTITNQSDSTLKINCSNLGATPTTRTINGKPLSANVTLNASDVGARANTWLPTKSDIGLGNVRNVVSYSEDETYSKTEVNNKLTKYQEYNLSSAFLTRTTANGYEIKPKSMTKLNYLCGNSKNSENIIVMDDVANTTLNGITYSITNGVITLNGTNTLGRSFCININLAYQIPQLSSISFNAFNFDNRDCIGIFLYDSPTHNAGINVKWNPNDDISSTFIVKTIGLWIDAQYTYNNYQLKPMLVIGGTAPTTFEQGYKYVKHALTSEIKSKDENNIEIGNYLIPSQIQALTGYGWGLSSTNKSNCNYIDFINKKFVQNIGKRAYASGDESNTSVLTDLTYTYYQLSTPIETDISELINENTYLANNGGTETIIGSDVAPLLDVTYNSDLDTQTVKNSNNIAELKNDKANKSTTYTKTEVDNKIIMLNDYDSTKGTVEERLTALGFKVGVASVNFETIGINSLRKEGKYVIANIIIANSSSKGPIIRIPAEFRPNTQITDNFNNDFYICFGTGGNNTYARGIVDSNGYIKYLNEESMTFINIPSCCGVEIVSVGWETE